MQENAWIIWKVLHHFKLRHPLESVLSFLLRYPYKGSLKSIEQAFKYFNVDSVALRIRKEQYSNLSMLPLPFIAHVKKESAKYIIVESIQGYYFNGYTSNGISKYSFDEFTGNVLIPFKQPTDSVSNVIDTIRLVRIALFLLFTFLFLHALTLLSSSFTIGSLLILKTTGLLISSIMFIGVYKPNDSTIFQVCNAIGGKCKDLLQHKEQLLGNLFTWVELGFFYFLFGVIAIFFSQSGVYKPLPILYSLCVPTLLFSLYSFYYQKYVSRQWCPFCLIILFIFLLEFLVLQTDSILFTLNMNDWIYISILAVMAFLITEIFNLYLQKDFFAKKLMLEYSFIKYNPDLLKSFKKEECATSAEDIAAIHIFGNKKKYENRLLVVVSPFCPPCKSAFQELKKLMIPSRKDDLSVYIIFSIDTNEERGTKKLEIAQKILHTYLFSTDSMKETLDLLISWYQTSDGNTDLFDRIIISDDRFSKINMILDAQRQWVISLDLRYTPAIVFNDQVLPKGYTVEDINYLI